MLRLLTIALLSFPLIAGAEDELKTLLTPDTHSALLEILKDQKQKHKKQENHYFDTQDYVLKHNGLNVRVRIVNDQKAELTVKDKAAYDPSPFTFEDTKINLDGTLQGDELTEKAEYECEFKSLKYAKTVLENPSAIIHVTEEMCSTIEKSHKGIHPSQFLKKRLSREFKMPDKKINLTSKDLKRVASNTNERMKVSVELGEHPLKLEVDHTTYDLVFESYGADLDITDVPQEAREKVRAAYHGLIGKAGQELNPPVAGKTTRTFLISTESKELPQLVKRGELLRRAQPAYESSEKMRKQTTHPREVDLDSLSTRELDALKNQVNFFIKTETDKEKIKRIYISNILRFGRSRLKEIPNVDDVEQIIKLSNEIAEYNLKNEGLLSYRDLYQLASIHSLLTERVGRILDAQKPRSLSEVRIKELTESFERLKDQVDSSAEKSVQ